MTTKDKQNPFTAYIAVTKTFFLIASFVIFLFGIIGLSVLPDERDAINTNCRSFDASWEQILDNGERIAVEIPGKIPAEFGEVVTIATTLPSKIQTGEHICFRLIWQDAEIYIGDELRETYTTKDSRFFGTNSPTRYVFAELYEKDASKELTFKFISNSKYTGDLRAIYIGDMLSIWLHLLKDCGTQTIVAIFLLLLSIFCILVCVILRFVYKKTLPLTHLACTLFFCAFWMLSEIDFRQLVVKNVSLLSCYAYWSLMLIPISLMLYINEIQNNYYKKVFFLPTMYSISIFVIGTLLQFLDIIQFVQFIPFIHIGIIAAIVCIIATITIDTITKRLSDYLFVGIGVYGMMLTAIIEMMLYYARLSLSLGTALAIGLLFLLIMAIVKTGQDLFNTEKKKQQAIMAREEQAKFLANMSHEIRTPINAIIGMNEMILRECDDATIKEYAGNIQSASNMLLGLVNDVLDFSKIESGQLELVEDTYHLPALLKDEMLFLNSRIAGKPISTQIEISPELPSKLLGDELRIKQVLTNLLSNAVKYTSQGSVTLKVYFEHLNTDTIQLCFSVIDTGIGIKKEDLSKLFTSFKRLELKKNRNIQGTGLGLNIAQQLANLMNGTISVDSEYGKGSTFTLAIPQKVIDSQPIGNLQTSLKQLKNNNTASKALFTAPKADILIVDDNSMNLSLMKGLLKRTEIKVDTATSGKECLALTKQKKYHIIFMDHMMPELDGVETLKLLKADYLNPNHDTTIIALTANAIAGCREMYLAYGFSDYFSKPVQPDKLEALIAENLPNNLVHMIENVALEDFEQKTDITTDITQSAVSENNQEISDLLEINHELGLSYCLNMESLYKEVLSKFYSQSKDYLPQLDKYVETQDWKNYSIIVHGLKSSALNIGASDFSKLSLEHELASKEGNIEFVIENYPKYIMTLKTLLDKVESML